MEKYILIIFISLGTVFGETNPLIQFDNDHGLRALFAESHASTSPQTSNAKENKASPIRNKVLLSYKDAQVEMEMEKGFSLIDERFIEGLPGSQLRKFLIRFFEKEHEEFRKQAKKTPKSSNTSEAKETFQNFKRTNESSKESASKHTQDKSNQSAKSAEQENSDEISLEWYRAPEYDFHRNAYHFYIKLVSSEAIRAYSRIIFLTRDGYVSFQYRGLDTPASREIYSKASQKLQIRNDLGYRFREPVSFRGQREIVEALLYPHGITPPKDDRIQEDQGTLEKNRKSAGIIFLICSLFFFLVIAPRLGRG